MNPKRLDPTSGQYAKATIHGGTVYLAGLIAEDWGADLPTQCQQIFQQIDDLLARAGSARRGLLSVTVYIADFADYSAFKTAWGRWIEPDHLPARATVRADLLDPRLKIEISAIAARLEDGHE
jgi:enamine deaminase RidA (YjgF/YER057c/UK114 family)